ncbi:MAG: glycosyltransferase [Lachnospiraceae bacterium]
MIFVTVGTHEQPFDRLIEYVDRKKGEKAIGDEIFIQTGFSNYEPVFCDWEKLVPQTRMEELFREADIVITHGGPASFMTPLKYGKMPIVVPRRREFSEHINDHQVEFCRAVKERYGNIILIEDIEELSDAVNGYEGLMKEKSAAVEGNTARFVREFEEIALKLIGENNV